MSKKNPPSCAEPITEVILDTQIAADIGLDAAAVCGTLRRYMDSHEDATTDDLFAVAVDECRDYMSLTRIHMALRHLQQHDYI